MDAEDRRNRNEQIKDALDPLDLRPRIDRSARDGLASIDPDDLNIRFRWWALYPQRPAEDGHFMLRIRIPGVPRPGAADPRGGTPVERVGAAGGA